MNPRKINPQRNHAISIPFKKSVYFTLFPNATKIPLKKRLQIKYQNTYNVYRYTCDPVDLEPILGEDWFFIHCQQSVGCFVGDITFTLKETVLMEYQTKLEEGCCTNLIPESLSILSGKYLHIKFKFTKFQRLEPGITPMRETNFWKYGRALASKKYKTNPLS